MQKLASKGGVFGFQIGSEFNNPRAYNYMWKAKKAGFWDTSAASPLASRAKTSYQIDAMEGSPHFRW